MPDLLPALGLFANAFVSATLLPGASEVMLAGLVAAGAGDPALLVLIAGTGNTLGSVANWLCGRFLLAYRDRRWFPVGPRQIERASGAFNRYGIWVLLFAWFPVGGDALTVIAGLLRVPLGRFVLLVALGKFARYAAVAAGALALAPA